MAAIFFDIRNAGSFRLDKMQAEVPGIQIRRQRGFIRVIAPINCAWLVEAKLDAGRVNYDVENSVGKPRFDARACPPSMHQHYFDTLMKHQRSAFAWSVNRKGSTYWHPAGSGKSRSAFTWMAANATGRKLWVTRAISKRSHAKEMQLVSTLRPQIISGISPFDVREDANVFVINWEIIAYHWQRLCDIGFEDVVFDEIHKAKNPVRFIAAHNSDGTGLRFVPKDNISYAAMELSHAASRRLCLTATPIKNRVKDLWAQLDLAEPNEWGKRAVWMKRYAGRHQGIYGEINDNGATNLSELRKRLSLSVHEASIAETHASLPPLRRQTIYIPAEELLSAREKASAKELAGLGPVEARLALSAARKRKAVEELVVDGAESNQHVCVFTARRNDAIDLGNRLSKKLKGVCPVYIAHGGVSTKERESIREAYMSSPDACVLIATGDSMGEAVDLNRTHVAIMAMLPYTPAQLEQWEKRFWRLGQLFPVLVVYPIALKTIDEHVAAILLEKLPAVETLTSGSSAGELANALMGGKSNRQIQDELLAMLTASEGEAA